MAISLRENNIKTDDSFISLGFNGIKKYIFHDIGEVATVE